MQNDAVEAVVCLQSAALPLSNVVDADTGAKGVAPFSLVNPVDQCRASMTLRPK